MEEAAWPQETRGIRTPEENPVSKVYNNHYSYVHRVIEWHYSMYCEYVLYYILYYLTLLVNTYNFIPYVHVYLDKLDQNIMYALEQNETILYVRMYINVSTHVPCTCRVYVPLLLPAQLDT